MAGLLNDLPPHCFCCCCWVSGEESRVCGCSVSSGPTCCSPTTLPFTCERSITTLRHTNRTEHATKRHSSNKTPDLLLPRTVAFAAARQRTQCRYCRCVHRRCCFFPASKQKDPCQAKTTTIPYHTLMHMLFCARYRLQLHISARKPPGTKSL